MSNIERTIQNDLQTTEPTWWVRFDAKTGKVFGLSQKPVVESDKYAVFETTDKTCVDILKRGSKNFVVRWDYISENWTLGDTTAAFYLKSFEFPFKNIKNSPKSTPAIEISMFKETKEIKVSAHLHQIQSEFNISQISSLVYDGAENYFDLYITEKNNPDKLIYTLTVDPKVLFTGNKILYSISDILRHVSFDNISIFCRHVFSSYAFHTYDKVVVDNGIDSKPIDRVTITDKYYCDIQLVKTSNTSIKVSLNGDVDLIAHKFNAIKYLKILVSDVIIDNIIGAFVIDTNTLQQKNDVDIHVDFDIPDDPVLIYKNKLLTISYKGELDD